MSGILDYSRWLNLNATENTVREVFPQDQNIFEIDINLAGSDGYSVDIEYKTLVFSDIPYQEQIPNFDNSLILGYFEGGSSSLGVSTNLVLPSNMYTGPILPNNPKNIPVTVVIANFSKASSSFQKTFILIQNWEPGVALGDPTLDNNYIPILDATTSSLQLSLLSGPVIYGQKFLASVESSLPTEILELGVANFYAIPPTTTTAQLVSVGTFTGNISNVEIATDTNNLTSGTYTIYAEWPGRRQYIKTQSNSIGQIVYAGIPLDVDITLTPPFVNLLVGDNFTADLTATIQAGYTPTYVEINNSATINLIPNVNSSRSQAVSSTSTFVNGYLTQNISGLDTTWLDKELTSSSVYTIFTDTLTSSSYQITALVTTTSTILVNWDFYTPGPYSAGSTTTNIQISGLKTYVYERQSLNIEAIEQIGDPGNITLTPVTQTYSRQGPYIQFESKSPNSGAINSGSVTFKALYTNTYETVAFTATSISTVGSKRILAPLMFQFNDQFLMDSPYNQDIVELKLPLNNLTGITTGSTFTLPTTTWTFTTTFIQNYVGELYDDQAIYAISKYRSEMNNFYLGGILLANVTFNNPDGSVTIAQINNPNSIDYIVEHKLGQVASTYTIPVVPLTATQKQNVGSAPDRLRLENTVGLKVGDYFKLEPSTSIYFDGSYKALQVRSTNTEYVITNIIGDTIFMAPPWGAEFSITGPSEWYNDLYAQLNQKFIKGYWYTAIEGLRHKSITFYRKNYEDSGLINPLGGVNYEGYKIMTVNDASKILPGATITFPEQIVFNESPLTTATVKNVLLETNQVELDTTRDITRNEPWRTFVFRNPDDRIILQNPRQTSQVESRLVSVNDRNFRFDILPFDLGYDDSFVINNQTFTITAVNTQTMTVTSQRPRFNIAPYFNSKVNFIQQPFENIFYIEYLVDDFGQRLNGDGINYINCFPQFNYSSVVPRFEGWLKFNNLPSDLRPGDKIIIIPETEIPYPVGLPGTRLAGDTLIIQDYVLTITEIKFNLNAVKVREPWVSSYNPLTSLAYYIVKALPSVQNTPWPRALAGHYPVQFSRTAVPLLTVGSGNYQTITLGTATSSTYESGNVVWRLTSASLNTGTYYVYSEPGNVSGFDPAYKPKSSTNKWPLVVESYQTTQFIGKWRPGVNEDKLEALNFEEEDFEQPVTWKYNTTVIGTSTWVRTGTFQISTLTVTTSTIQNYTLVQAQWPGTIEDYRNSTTQTEFTTATFTVSPYSQSTLTAAVANLDNDVPNQLVNITILPADGDLTTSPIPTGTVTLSVIPYNTSTEALSIINTFTGRNFVSKGATPSEMFSAFGNYGSYFTTGTLITSYGGNNFYLPSNSVASVFSYAPGKPRNFIAPGTQVGKVTYLKPTIYLGLMNISNQLTNSQTVTQENSYRYSFFFTATVTMCFSPGALLTNDKGTPQYSLGLSSVYPGFPTNRNPVFDYKEPITETLTYNSQLNQYLLVHKSVFQFYYEPLVNSGDYRFAPLFNCNVNFNFLYLNENSLNLLAKPNLVIRMDLTPPIDSSSNQNDIRVILNNFYKLQ